MSRIVNQNEWFQCIRVKRIGSEKILGGIFKYIKRCLSTQKNRQTSWYVDSFTWRHRRSLLQINVEILTDIPTYKPPNTHARTADEFREKYWNLNNRKLKIESDCVNYFCFVLSCFSLNLWRERFVKNAPSLLWL